MVEQILDIQSAKKYGIFRYHWVGIENVVDLITLTQILNQTTGHVLKSLTWELGNIEEHDVSGPQVISALLGGIRNKNELTFDPDAKLFTPAENSPTADNLIEVFFINDFHAFGVEIKSSYRPSTLANYVARIINGSSAMGVMSFDFDPITIEGDFLERVYLLDRVDRINVTLRPSNPRHRETWKAADLDLQEARVGEERKVLKAKNNEGINVRSRLVQSDLTQAVDGYGKAKVQGLDGQIPKTISTGKEVAEINIPESVSEAEKFARVYSEVSRIASLRGD